MIPSGVIPSGCQSPNCEHAPNVDGFYFDLACDLIGDPEDSMIRFPSTTLEGLSNSVWILKVSQAFSGHRRVL